MDGDMSGAVEQSVLDRPDDCVEVGEWPSGEAGASGEQGVAGEDVGDESEMLPGVWPGVLSTRAPPVPSEMVWP